MAIFYQIVFLGSALVSLTVGVSLDGASTGMFLDTLTKSLKGNQETACDRPTANQTNPYFFGVTDLKCLNIEARLRRHGFNIESLRQKFPRFLGKRSIAMETPISQDMSEEGNDNTDTRQKRSPSRNTLRPVHRWIFYDGYFIEFGAGSGNIGKRQVEQSVSNANMAVKQNEYSLSNANIQPLYPKNGDICSAKMESEAAGYSSVSLECLHRCARSYVSEFGEYNLIKNNCHRFANTISDILCTGICPIWCK